MERRSGLGWSRGGAGASVVSLLLLALLASCSRQHDDNDFLPTAPDVRGALVLVFSAELIPADGVSTVEIVAEIDPQSDFRKVEFVTDKGTFLNPDSDSSKKKTTEADIDGKATARLKSETVAGTATITVSVKGPAEPGVESSPEVTKVSVTGTVEFSRLAPDTLTFTIDGDSLPADGFSVLELVARVDPSLPIEYRAIRFEATAPGIIRGGTTVSGSTTSTRDVTADADGVARAELTSPTTAPQTGFADVTAKLVNFPDVLKTFVIEFTPFEPGFIQLSTSADSIPADGFSTVELLAVIPADTPPDFRGVVFSASPEGTLSPGDGRVTADVNGEARAQLRSSKVIGPVEVKAELATDDSVFATKFVEFTAPDSGAIIQLSPASSSAPADGETQTTITAEVTPELGQGNTVTFTTSLGTLSSSSATANDGRASVTIRSATVGTALLTAQVDDFVAEASLSFTQAFPDTIEVQAGDFVLPVADKTRDISVFLRRNPGRGRVSEGTFVVYDVVKESDGSPIPDIVFRSIMPSTLVGSLQKSTAEMVVEGTTFTGLAIVRATVEGSGAPAGEDTVKIE